MSNDAVDVLVADDNAVLLSVLSEILKECGHSVRTVSDGLGALAAIRNRIPDILLSDLNMPRMSGFELLSIVRRCYPKINVIAMSTAYSGAMLPRTIAADAFYEKGATSVARLLQMVNAMKDGPQLRASRISTPIWIPKRPLDSTGRSSAFLACPECLRAHSYLLEETDSVHYLVCPYCLYRVQLAIAPVSVEIGECELVALNS